MEEVAGKALALCLDAIQILAWHFHLQVVISLVQFLSPSSHNFIFANSEGLSQVISEVQPFSVLTFGIYDHNVQICQNS